MHRLPCLRTDAVVDVGSDLLLGVMQLEVKGVDFVRVHLEHLGHIRESSLCVYSLKVSESLISI